MAWSFAAEVLKRWTGQQLEMKDKTAWPELISRNGISHEVVENHILELERFLTS
jgi:hypothetical protein